MNRKTLLGLFYLFAAFTLTLGADKTNEPIRISGSDFLATPLSEAWDVLAEERNEVVEVDWPGSYPARQALEKGKIDIALVALPEETSFDTTRFSALPFAYQAVFVAVHEENPLQSITIEDLRGIYAAEAAENKNQWDAFGLRGVWLSRSISAHIFDIPNVFAPLLFCEYYLNHTPLKTRVQSWDNADALLKYFADNRTGIAILPSFPELYEQSTLRILSVINDDKQIPFSPKPENIHTGDYPLQLTFFALYKETRKTVLKPYLKRLFEDDLADRLEENYFTPLPESIRRDETLKFL